MTDSTTRDPSVVKTCSKCGATQPATVEFFYRHPQGADGFDAQCKECKRAYRQANRERLAAAPRAYREANRAALAEQSRAYYKANREARAEYYRAYQQKKREAVAEYQRAYYQANRAEIGERKRAYREANPGIAVEYVRAWQKANPEAVKATAQRRRARQCNAEGTHTGGDIEEQYKRQKGKCFWCGEKVHKTYHVDHVVPLSRGGSDGPENLVIACPSCNLAKHDKLPHEWIEGGRLL